MSSSNSSFAVNPFTLIFDALWAMVEDSPNFVADIKVNNRIHLNIANDPNPLKQQIQDADLPEILLVPTGISESNLFSTSSTTKIVRQYNWILSTGDLRVQNYLHQVEWNLFCAMTGWQSLLGNLIWPANSGRNFVKRCGLLAANQGLNDNEKNRGLIGWSSIWGCEVESHFMTQDLIDFRGY